MNEAKLYSLPTLGKQFLYLYTCKEGLTSRPTYDEQLCVFQLNHARVVIVPPRNRYRFRNRHSKLMPVNGTSNISPLTTGGT